MAFHHLINIHSKTCHPAGIIMSHYAASNASERLHSVCCSKVYVERHMRCQDYRLDLLLVTVIFYHVNRYCVTYDM